MPLEPLVESDDLAGFPGAPFSDEVTAAAGESIRNEAGWHIAPSLTETVTIDSVGGSVLMLPTLHLTAVAAVRDVSGDSPVELTGWRWSEAGMLSRRGGWPCGFRSVEVDMVHGYEWCPPELFPIIADRTARRVQQESLGSRSVSFAAGVGGVDALSGVVARYKLPARP